MPQRCQRCIKANASLFQLNYAVKLACSRAGGVRIIERHALKYPKFRSLLYIKFMGQWSMVPQSSLNDQACLNFRCPNNRSASFVNEPVAEQRLQLYEEKLTIEKRLLSSKAMLEHYQGPIKAGLARITLSLAGQVFLADANSSLAKNMAKLAAVSKKIHKT